MQNRPPASIWLSPLLADAPAILSLAPNEQDCLSRLQSPLRRQQFISGRILAKRLLSGLDGDPDPSTYHLEADSPQGKPRPHHRRHPLPDIDLSLAHRGQWVALAAGHHSRIGIDIEIKRPLRDASTLREFLSASREEAALVHHPNDWLRFWTIKEAALKLNGNGFSDDPRRWEIRIEGPHRGTLSTRYGEAETYTWWEFPHPELLITIATDQPALPGQ